MSTTDVCLISESAHSAREIEDYLRLLGSYFVRRHPMTKIDFTDPESSEAIIFDSRAIYANHFACLWRIARQFTDKPALVVAQDIPIQFYRQLYMLKNLSALQKPCDPKHFGDILAKIVRGESLGHDRFPRFNTDQPIRMMVMRTGLFLPSRMKNYSVGGAFVEYRGISLRVGDELQVSFENSSGEKLQKSQLMPAKVIWIRSREEVATRGPGIGVQFLQPLSETLPPAAEAR